MNKRSIFSAITLTLAAMSLPALGQPGTPARENPAGIAPPAAPVVNNASVTTQKVLPELQFDNVDLVSAIDYLRDVSGLNIVLLGDPGVDLGSIHINFRLKNVTLEQTLEVLAMTPGYNIQIAHTADNGPAPILIVRVIVVPQPGMEKVTNAASLRGIFPGTDDKSPESEKKLTEQVTALIDAAVKTLGDNPDGPKIYYHPGTRLVIYRGSPEQVQLLDTMFKTLQSDAKAPPADLELLKTELDKSNAAREEMMNEVRQRELEITKGQIETKAMEEQAQQFRAQTDQQMKRNDELKAEIDSLQEKLVQMQAEVQAARSQRPQTPPR